jgi:hypothetical protein
MAEYMMNGFLSKKIKMQEGYYIQRIAFTKYVHKNGRVTQNHSGHVNKSPIVATNEIMVYNQYVFTDSAAVDINIFISFKK